jgi:aldehyde dehydrogenase (NAD+)
MTASGATTAHDPMLERDALYIRGRWVASAERRQINVINPATEGVLGSVPAGCDADVDRAVSAAREASAEWAATPPAERAEWIGRIATAISERAEQFAHLLAMEVGTPLNASRVIQVALAVADWAAMPDAIAEVAWEERVGNSLVLREPVGVVGAITPWNYPLHQVSAKAAAALAAGCTIVIKPSEIAPLSTFLLADVIDALELPAGVFNVVSGEGVSTGEALARHPWVDMVSFTGSTRAGRRVSELAAASVKPVALELGGKSAAIVLADADLRVAVEGTIAKCYQNAGQTCSALTRMLVPRAALREAETIAAAVARSFTLGDPLDEAVTLGPLVSSAQLDRVRAYIRQGEEEGARLVCGGEQPPSGYDRGYFVQPTVFSDVHSTMRIAQEEIFGPVLSIIPYDDEDDAVRLANDSQYGLSGAVWSADVQRATRIARRVRTGQVTINGGPFNSRAPFGGRNQSGHGRELGRFGLEEFLTYKSLQT